MDDVTTRSDGPAPPVLPGPPPPAAPAPMTWAPRSSTPQTIGPYTILKLLGVGGMGVVYAAYDAELDRKVAIKLLHPRSATGPTGTTGTRRLLREAQAMAKISHPNVLPVFEAGTHDDRVYVVLEYVDGTTLRTWAETPRRWEQVLAVFLQVGEGLRAAHEADIVHRDLKPDNILIDARGRVRVMDFGLARSIGDPVHADDGGVGHVSTSSSFDLALTIPGSVMGTPAYMPPEQMAGKPVDARCDQFSLCVSMWEVLYGVRPFAGADIRAIARSIAEGQLEAPESSRVPAWLRAVLIRGLAARPEARFTSIAALLAALRADPRVLVRRVLFGVLAALCVGAAVLGFVLAAAAEADACAGGEQRFAEVWPPTRADAVQAAFAATGRPHADATADHVRAGLDRHAGAWVAMHHDACATSRRGEQSGDMLDRRMVCLDRRRGEVAAMLDLFTAADGDIVDRAVATVEALTPVALCGDVAALAAAVALPTDLAVRARVDELHRELDAQTVAMRAGKLAAALTATESLHARAEALAYPPLVADAALLRGTLLGRLGRPDDAETWLFRALWLAEAHHHDQVVATAWIELVRVTGESKGQHDVAPRWAEGADAALIRIGDPPLQRANLLSNRGNVALLAQRYPEAHDLYTAALRLRREQLGDDAVEVADTYNNLGNVFLKQGHRSEARAMHERAISLRERLLGPTHPDVASSCVNLASLTDDRDEALSLLARAESILRASTGETDPRLTSILINRANILAARGQRTEARRLFEQALVLLETASPDGPIVPIVRVNLAKLRILDGEYAAASLLLATELARRTAAGSPRDARLADLQLDLAGSRAFAGEYAAAEALLRANLGLLTELGDPDGTLTMPTRMGLVHILLRAQRTAEAAEELRALTTTCATPPARSDGWCAELPFYTAELALLRLDHAAARSDIRAYVADWNPDDELHSVAIAEKNLVHGQILWESGADRSGGRRLVVEAWTGLRSIPEYDPAYLAEVSAWLDRHPG